MLSTMIITKIQESCIHSFQINHSVSYGIFHLNILLLKNSEFSCIKLWFTDRNSKPLEMEDKINITLVIN